MNEGGRGCLDAVEVREGRGRGNNRAFDHRSHDGGALGPRRTLPARSGSRVVIGCPSDACDSREVVVDSDASPSTKGRPSNLYQEQPVKYLCLAYGDRKKLEALTKAQFEDLLARCRVFDEELQKSGHFVQAESLEWGVTTLRAKDGKTVVTDGPFVETRETVGGLIVIEARDLNEAIRIASMHPAARMGEQLGWGIELRPISPTGCHQ
jgi:hypothetical protein